MTSTRDLIWQNVDLMYQSSVARQLARYALHIDYPSLPKEVVHEAKRGVLDALACIIGGYTAPGRPICQEVAQELGGPEEATMNRTS